MEEEGADETEVAYSPNLSLSNKPLASQAEPSLLKIIKKMTLFMGHLSQEVSSRDTSKVPAFKTLSMKAPDSFDGTQYHELRGFIKLCQLSLHNEPGRFFSERKKILYSAYFLTGRAGKWIEAYLSNIYNEYHSYLLTL
ncbi:hypothetical protein O181_030974 [Austropuccinia psidii MF-1]|uniref:DUF4939 domain-containing protein n=1 Tax=Austropuccinia psidii MF-1 TaxID=1389203 RepID=A0A9Q3H626_9BASI|nr:hypothetical protein [Austropuccinia psidii MF-1]